MRNILSGLTGLALAIAFGAGPASAFSGSYTLTMYSGPERTMLDPYCVVFTQTSNILGFPDSGTWDVPIFEGYFHGNFVHDGAVLRWYGATGVTFAFSNKIKANGKVAPGGFDAWGYVDGVLTAAGDGITTLKANAGC